MALEAFLVLAHGANKELFGDGRFLALDQDASLPSWATVVLYALAGTACGLLAWLSPELRWPLVALAGLAILLSLESTVQIHEGLEKDAGDSIGRLAEVVVGGGFVAVLWLAGRVVPRPFGWLIWAAIATITAAAASSAINGRFDLPYAGLIFFQTLEEVSEMLTAILILAAVAEPLLGALGRRLGADGLSEPRPMREPEGATPLRGK